jgi:hypothetical protein
VFKNTHAKFTVIEEEGYFGGMFSRGRKRLLSFVLLLSSIFSLLAQDFYSSSILKLSHLPSASSSSNPRSSRITTNMVLFQSRQLSRGLFEKHLLGRMASNEDVSGEFSNVKAKLFFGFSPCGF